MIAGFTGTQEGMTKKQQNKLIDLLDELGVMELHHGDCIGADEECHVFAQTIGIRIVIHPPDNDSKRAFCKKKYGGVAEEREPKPYLVRNDDIAEDGEILIATPKEFEEQQRSGTWTTVRYARKKFKDVIIIFPDGTIKIRN